MSAATHITYTAAGIPNTVNHAITLFYRVWYRVWYRD